MPSPDSPPEPGDEYDPDPYTPEDIAEQGDRLADIYENQLDRRFQ